MPATTTLVRASRRKASTTEGTAQALKTTLSGRSGSLPRSGSTVPPSPFGYCSVAWTGRPSRRAPSIRKSMLRTTSWLLWILSISFCCTSITSRPVSPACICVGWGMAASSRRRGDGAGSLSTATAPTTPSRLADGDQVREGPEDNPAARDRRRGVAALAQLAAADHFKLVRRCEHDHFAVARHVEQVLADADRRGVVRARHA